MATAYIKSPQPIGYLRHDATNSVISVFKHINWFQRRMLYWCFGLKYESA